MPREIQFSPENVERDSVWSGSYRNSVTHAQRAKVFKSALQEFVSLHDRRHILYGTEEAVVVAHWPKAPPGEPFPHGF